MPGTISPALAVGSILITIEGVMNLYGSKARKRQILRRFKCEYCGKIVKITKPLDKREHFCSYTCSVLYKKEHAKKI